MAVAWSTWAVPSYGADAVEYDLEIEPQPLGTALQEFSKQSGVQVVFLSKIADGLAAPEVKGRFTVDSALRRLLQRSELTFRELNSKTIEVQSRAQLRGAGSSAMRLAQVEDEAKDGQGVQKVGEASDPQEDMKNLMLEEIIVTAQKRDQRLQDVPGAVTSLSGDKLEARGLDQLSDITKAVPGLVVIGGGNSPGQGQPVLRGISTAGDRNPLVGLYLDDVPFTTSSPRFQGTGFNFDPAIADIERVEVLKGPQSTLYGASTMGGLIKYVSKKPDTQNFESQVAVGVSQIDGYGSGGNSRLSTNIPLVEGKLALRATAFYRKSPGFVENAFYRQKNKDSSASKGFKLSVLAELGDNLDNTLTFFSQRIRTDGSSNVFFDPVTRKAGLGWLANSTPVDERFLFDADMLANTTNIDLSFAMLTNVASYSRFAAGSDDDITRVSATLCPTYCFNKSRRVSKRLTDELRIASKPGAFEWLLGGFITREDVTFPQKIRRADANGFPIENPDPAQEVDNYLTTGTYNEKAVFGNVTYHFTDNLEVTGGIRYSANNQDYTTVTSGLLRGTTNLGFAVSDSATNYLATITFKPTTHLSLYARAASAYRPGGPNSIIANPGVPTSYKADSLWNYEIGAKGSALDGAVNFSVAAYHMDWTDIQVNLRYTAANGQQFSATGNAGGATSDGAEVELNLFPVRGLNLTFSGAYNNSKITSNPGTLANVGDPLPYSPKWTGTAIADYEREVSPGLVANIGATYAYVGSRLNQFKRNTASLAPLDAYGTLDLHAGIRWDKYSLTARVDNVANRLEFTQISAPGIFYKTATWLAIPLTPRSFSLSFQANF